MKYTVAINATNAISRIWSWRLKLEINASTSSSSVGVGTGYWDHCLPLVREPRILFLCLEDKYFIYFLFYSKFIIILCTVAICGEKHNLEIPNLWLVTLVKHV